MNSKVLEPPARLLENLEMLLRLNGRDWAEDRADAWLYGVIVGWTDDPFDDTDGMETIRAIAAKHNWTEERIEQLLSLHRQWKEAKLAEQSTAQASTADLESILDDLESRANSLHAKGSTSLTGVRSAGRADGYLEAVRLVRKASGL